MKIRLAVASLTLSAAGLIGLAVSEGYRGEAYIPLPGDRPTLGFGDAQGVELGQKTTPVRALVRLGEQVGAFEQELKACFGEVELYQHEWDSYIKLAVNVGSSAVCTSSIPAKLQAKQYESACRTILDFNKFRDCSKPKVWNAKKRRLECPLVPQKGLTIRRQNECQQCMGAES